MLISALPAHADLTLTGSIGGQCCFNVNLNPFSDGEMQVTVNPVDGTWQYGVLGFSLVNDPAITITTVSAPTGAGSVYLSTAQGGSNAYDYYVNIPGAGPNSTLKGPLVVDINSPGINYSSFIVANGDYYFASNPFAGVSDVAISTPAVQGPVPEPSSLLLLSTGVLGAGGFFKRRIVGALGRA